MTYIQYLLLIMFRLTTFQQSFSFLDRQLITLSFAGLKCLIACLLFAGARFCQVLLYLIDWLDGGDDEDPAWEMDELPHYNYRSGNMDPIKRWEGLYAHTTSDCE